MLNQKDMYLHFGYNLVRYEQPDKEKKVEDTKEEDESKRFNR
jgi:hypothetical protein